MHFRLIYVIPALLGLAAYGQTPAEQPSFEVASVRQSVTDPMKGIMVRASGGPGSKDPTRFTTLNFSLSNLVTMAYGINHWQLSAPELDRSREMFDVAATVPEGATKEQFQLMLQRLLAERFGLKVHWDTKEMPLYELVVAKNGPKFKESKGEKEDPAAEPAKPFGPPKRDSEGYPEMAPGRSGTIMMSGRARMQTMHETMEHFAGMMSGQVRGPVKDATGLTGKYDIAIYWSTSESPRAAAPAASAVGGTASAEPDYSSGPTIFEALRDQLGLTLEKKKGPVKVLVVDHFEKLPTPN